MVELARVAAVVQLPNQVVAGSVLPWSPLDSPLAGAAPRASPRGQKGDVPGRDKGIGASASPQGTIQMLTGCIREVSLVVSFLVCPSFPRVGRRGEPAAAPP